MTNFKNKSLWALMFLLSLAIAAYGINFTLTLHTQDSIFAERALSGQFQYYIHFIFGSLTLVCGALQFNKMLRTSKPNIHRLLGKIYLISVLLSGVAGFIMAVNSVAGLISGIGFGLLALLWLYSGWMAYSSIRRGDVQAHKDWMIRNFSLTLAAVTLRIYLGVFLGALQLDFQVAYTVIAYMCWIPNLLIAELIVRRGSTNNPSQLDSSAVASVKKARISGLLYFKVT